MRRSSRCLGSKISGNRSSRRRISSNSTSGQCRRGGATPTRQLQQLEQQGDMGQGDILPAGLVPHGYAGWVCGGHRGT